MSEKLANPAPLGLFGFGLTTVLLNLHNAGFYPLDSMILAMGLAYGGLAQIVAGLMEFRKGNTFGTVAFTSYGLFWWSLVMLLLLPKITVLGGGAVAPTTTATAAYFVMWGIFTFAMFFGTLRANHALQFVFITLAILFFILASRDFASASGMVDTAKTIGQIAGFEGIICGSSAIYLAIAHVLNEVHGKTVLPIGPVIL